jgi:hypothetical protein
MLEAFAALTQMDPGSAADRQRRLANLIAELLYNGAFYGALFVLVLAIGLVGFVAKGRRQKDDE